MDGLSELKRKAPDDVHDRIKTIACYLFATRGVDGVTIRDILAAARVKNAGAVGYYFGSKDNLVRQILIDGTALIERRRGELLDAALSSGKTLEIQDIVEIILHAIVDQQELSDRRFIGFTLMVSMTHRDLYLATSIDQPTVNYARCIAALKQLMPPMPEAARHQRVMFMKSNMAVALARREAALAKQGSFSNEWAYDHTLRHYIQAETAMLASPFVAPANWPTDRAIMGRDPGLIIHDPL